MAASGLLCLKLRGRWYESLDATVRLLEHISTTATSTLTRQFFHMGVNDLSASSCVSGSVSFACTDSSTLP
jgi:hypothetical protein